MADTATRPTHPLDAGWESVPTGALILADGTVFKGYGIGAIGSAVGEVCFNTSITGYQEIITDPSYAGQIITFTFPHIGNVGANDEDMETRTPAARGIVIKADITDPANFRSVANLNEWLKSQNLVGICGIDTRALTRLIREKGMPHGVVVNAPDGQFDIEALSQEAKSWPGLEGMDLAKGVSRPSEEAWDGDLWSLKSGYGTLDKPKHNVVAVDFGAKDNILRCLVHNGCKVTVVPATISAEDILAHKPDGVFLSNGPGDPAATGEYAVPMIQQLLKEKDLPVFGICLGHQMLALALGGKTVKMHQGHHGANHPVKDFTTGKVEITSMNHGFAVDADSLPDGIKQTHISLFDGSNCGLAVEGRPVFSVQHHPEASPGPQDSHYLFKRFADLMVAASNTDKK